MRFRLFTNDLDCEMVGVVALALLIDTRSVISVAQRYSSLSVTTSTCYVLPLVSSPSEELPVASAELRRCDEQGIFKIKELSSFEAIEAPSSCAS